VSVIHLHFMKSNKEALEIIVNIEKNVAVDEIEFRDIKIWPLIRLEIWKQLTHVKKENDVKNITKHRVSYFFSKILIIFSYLKHALFEEKYEESDAVFLSSPNNRWEKVDGKYFRSFLNSMRDILKELGFESVILDIATKEQRPVYEENYFILKKIESICSMYRIINFFKTILNLNKQTDMIYNWDALIRFTVSKYPELSSLDKQSIIERANKILFCEKIFKKILEQIKPKICFLECYYNPISMGYIKACRSLGIRTVEIQHSQQDLGVMYISWTRIPKNGYSLLPAVWWCWGKKSANTINEWSNKIYPEHRAIIGGNPWLAKNLNGDYKIDYIHTGKLMDLSENKTNVLVALQPIEPILSTNLMESITNSPQNINWLIRLHPAIYTQMSKIKNQLKDISNKNVEVEYSSEMPLFNLLKKVDFMITSWSGVAYEALMFGVHPIIIHPNGKNAFKEYIEQNLFTYAPSSQEIIGVLKQNKSEFNFKESTPYMETNVGKMKEIIIDLLK